MSEGRVRIHSEFSKPQDLSSAKPITWTPTHKNHWRCCQKYGFYFTMWAPQAKILRFQSATKEILPHKMSATGDFCGSRALLRLFHLTKWAPRAKTLWFQSATKGILPATKEILPYKISAAGENITVSERYWGNFTLQNKRRRRKFCDFGELQRGFYLTEFYNKIRRKNVLKHSDVIFFSIVTQ